MNSLVGLGGLFGLFIGAMLIIGAILLVLAPLFIWSECGKINRQLKITNDLLTLMTKMNMPPK